MGRRCRYFAAVLIGLFMGCWDVEVAVTIQTNSLIPYVPPAVLVSPTTWSKCPVLDGLLRRLQADPSSAPKHEVHRRLTTTSSTSVDPLSYFTSVTGKGLRGFFQGGEFFDTNATICAQKCLANPDCLSFDVDALTTCYISYTDRYQHPEAFLDFSSAVYYEWKGAVAPPRVEPNGGIFHTSLVVQLSTTKLSASIKYHIFASTDSVFQNATLDPTGQIMKQLLLTSGVTMASSEETIELPNFACHIVAMAVKDGMLDSTVLVSKEYQIYASKYAFLTPGFNSQYHGKVVRVQLDVKGKKRPRPARFHEFSDYGSWLGTGPYTRQINVIDLTKVDPTLKGFRGSFTAFAKANYTNETFIVVNADNPAINQTQYRIVLQAYYTPHPNRTGTPQQIQLPAEYLYLAPEFNGQQYFGTIVRILTSTFAEPNPVIQTLNLTTLDATLTGFGDAFTDLTYGYFVTHGNDVNGHVGKLVRVDLENFSLTGVQVLNLQAMDARYVGFSSSFVYDHYAFLITRDRELIGLEKNPNLREFNVPNAGLVVRVNLQDFATVDALDLRMVHASLAGFVGAVVVTHFAYFVPFMQLHDLDSLETNPYSGLVARVDLRDFTSVQVLDLTLFAPDLRGFHHGFAYKHYVVLVPSRWMFYHPRDHTQFGKVVRIDTLSFPNGSSASTTNNNNKNTVTWLDLPTQSRSQVPDNPDKDLRGFIDGFASGRYGFFVPYFNGATFSGKMCRINLEKFNEVQELDLTAFDPALAGFHGSTVTKSLEPLEVDLFQEFQVRTGTITAYTYDY